MIRLAEGSSGSDDFENDLYSATNYHFKLSEAEKIAAENDCQQARELYNEITFYKKTRQLQRGCLEMSIEEQFEMFTWLENVRNLNKLCKITKYCALPTVFFRVCLLFFHLFNDCYQLYRIERKNLI